jgi:two-component system, LytTR family, response regulator
MQLTCLIVDDEMLAREGLRLLLAGDPDISVVREAVNGREAVEAIRRERPDLVFLDVQMPEMDGFGVLKEVGPDRMPPVVFVTAHDEYAIRAFETSAIDYLLKPVTAARFAQSVARAKARIALPPEAPTGHIIALLETLAAPSRYLERLAIRSTGKTSFVNVDELDWISAAENYVELHAGSATHLLHVGINTLEKSLDPRRFLRIHRSTIVNIVRIKEMRAADHGEYTIVLQNGVRLQSSRTYHARVKALTANPF